MWKREIGNASFTLLNMDSTIRVCFTLSLLPLYLRKECTIMLEGHGH